MSNFQDDFKSFGSKIWLNAASEGPLPKVSGESLIKAIEWKSLPFQLTDERFVSVQVELKESIGQLINVSPREVILSNSASYGLHILADGISWEKGDEILLMQNDFPTDIVPWLALEKQGVVVKQIKPKTAVIMPDELLENITDKTKLFCVAHVHTFSGHVFDIEEFSKICQDKGIIFVLNISQSVGSMPIDISQIHVDAVVTAGYKWLCGPYGTGFAWIKPELRDQLDLNRAYWPSYLSEKELHSEDAITVRDSKSARKYDVFGTANFFNFVPFKSSIDYFQGIGLQKVQEYNQTLIDKLLEGLDMNQYKLVSPRERQTRSSLVVISHVDNSRNKTIAAELIKRDIYPALWKNNIRIAPHVYNSVEQMERVVEVLNEVAG